jgi:hypothetical protein
LGVSAPDHAKSWQAGRDRQLRDSSIFAQNAAWFLVVSDSVGAALTLRCQSGRSYGASSVTFLYFYRRFASTGLLRFEQFLLKTIV